MSIKEKSVDTPHHHVTLSHTILAGGICLRIPHYSPYQLHLRMSEAQVSSAIITFATGWRFPHQLLTKKSGKEKLHWREGLTKPHPRIKFILLDLSGP